MSPLQRYTTRVLHYWRVIVAITVLGALLSVAWAFTVATTTWTATAALTTQSQTRAPEQDAVLSLGYVDYFNQATYQDVLRSEAKIPSGVKLTAKTGATSPILYIEAAGAQADPVRSAAAAAAEQFRKDVQTSLLAERTQTANGIQGQIDKYVVSLQQPGRTQAEGNVILDQIRSLQGRLTDLQSDDTNLLKSLQPTPGVANTSASPAIGLASGAVGGLVLGVLVALVMVVLDTRLRSAGDVRQRLGLPTVAEFGARTTHVDRVRRVENLANTLSLAATTTGDAVVVVVVAPRHSLAASAFARDLAITGASRRSGTILVRSDLRNGPESDRPGLVDLIDGRATVPASISIGPDGLAEIPRGHWGGRDPYAVFEPDRFVQIIEEISKAHGLVVIDAPPLLDASESQIICDVADHVLVVVDRGATRWTEARDAVALLGLVNARVTGVVIDDPREAVAGIPKVADPAAAAPTEALAVVDTVRAPVKESGAKPKPKPRPEPVTVAAAKINGTRSTSSRRAAAARASVPDPEDNPVLAQRDVAPGETTQAVAPRLAPPVLPATVSIPGTD